MKEIHPQAPAWTRRRFLSTIAGGALAVATGIVADGCSGGSSSYPPDYLGDNTLYVSNRAIARNEGVYGLY